MIRRNRKRLTRYAFGTYPELIITTINEFIMKLIAVVSR